jgi:DDE superfamily endonuclease
MTPRKPCPTIPGPMEDDAGQFDDLFGHRAQRQRFREYLQGLLLPRDRNKTLTAFVGAAPVWGASHAAVQRLQSFVSESTWDATAVNRRRLEVLQADPWTTTHEAGVLVIDDTGDRKSGTQTAHVGRQYLGSVGKIDNGIVVVSTLWADDERYYPLHAEPYTPARRLPKGQADAAFRTKPQMALHLIEAALEMGVLFRAIVADSGYGENPTLTEELEGEDLPYVVSVKPSTGIWAPVDAVHTPQEAAEALPWRGAAEPGPWIPVVRTFRDGHTERWWTAELVYGPYGPERLVRRVVATTDPEQSPAASTWYVETNLPAPDSKRAMQSPLAAAPLAEIVRLYGLRGWVEQSYKQLKNELGWADAMVRADVALRRHWVLIFCAFTFCWCHWLNGVQGVRKPDQDDASQEATGGKKVPSTLGPVAGNVAPGPWVAHAVDSPTTLVARVAAGTTAVRPPETCGVGG